MYGHHADTHGRTQQRRDVAVADDRLRVAGEPAQVEEGNDTLAAIASACAEDGAHVRSVEHVLQVGAPRFVIASDVRLARQYRSTDLHLEPQPLEHADAPPEPLLVHHPRRGDDTNDITGAEAGRLADRRPVQPRVEIPAAPSQVNATLQNHDRETKQAACARRPHTSSGLPTCWSSG